MTKLKTSKIPRHQRTQDIKNLKRSQHLRYHKTQDSKTPKITKQNMTRTQDIKKQTKTSNNSSYHKTQDIKKLKISKHLRHQKQIKTSTTNTRYQQNTMGLPGSPKPQPREVQNYLLSGLTRKSKTSTESGAELFIIWAYQEV